MRQSAGGVSWEIATRAPAPALRPFIRDFCGYTEQGAPGLVRRTEFPGPQVVVIFDFGPPLAILDHRDGDRVCRYPGGFVAGLDDRSSVTEHQGFQRGLQLNLTPIGARLFFDLPMSEIAGRVVHFNDLVPSELRYATEQLASLPDWEARFDFIEALVTSRVSRASGAVSASADAANRSIAWAYTQIQQSGGTVEVQRIADALGHSRARLVALFRDQVGFPPKLVARIVRFERLIKHLKMGGRAGWADLAADCGYYDQAHLVHDVRQFAGMTPTQVRAAATGTPSGTTLEALRAEQDTPRLV